jgi:hypothetical protein
MTQADYEDHSSQVAELHEIVAARLNLQWERFAVEHPNLAAAIEQTMLTEMIVSDLNEDEEFRAAMEAASHDEAALNGAMRAIEIVDRVVTRALRI